MRPGSFLARAAFVVFALVLFTATHWPQLRIVGPVPRTDLWLHVAAFGVWTVLCGASAWWRPWHAKRSLGIVWVVGVLYAAFDEGLQLIPAIGRFASWQDYAANVAGVTLGVVVLAGIARFRADDSIVGRRT